MVKLEYLQTMVLLGQLNEVMLKKLADIAVARNIKAEQLIFHEGDEATEFFAVIEGKVTLEMEKNPGDLVRIMDIVPGRTFGISSLVDDQRKRCMTGARALMESKLVVWKVSDLEVLFKEEPQLGFLFMKGVARVLKGRLQIKNAQMAQVA